MITITTTGRLASQPELRVVNPTFQVCEFRLLSTRFARGEEHTESVTFFCFGEDAEEFCSTTVKGQEISATGVQETSRYKDRNGQEQVFVKYRMTWFQRGRKPFTGQRNAGSQEPGGRYEGNRDGGNSPPPRDSSNRNNNDGFSNAQPRNERPLQGENFQPSGVNAPSAEQEFL